MVYEYARCFSGLWHSTSNGSRFQASRALGSLSPEVSPRPMPKEIRLRNSAEILITSTTRHPEPESTKELGDPTQDMIQSGDLPGSGSQRPKRGLGCLGLGRKFKKMTSDPKQSRHASPCLGGAWLPCAEVRRLMHLRRTACKIGSSCVLSRSYSLHGHAYRHAWMHILLHTNTKASPTTQMYIP